MKVFLWVGVRGCVGWLLGGPKPLVCVNTKNRDCNFKQVTGGCSQYWEVFNKQSDFTHRFQIN